MARVKMTRTKIDCIYWYKQGKNKKFAYRYKYYDKNNVRRERSRQGFDTIEQAERELINIKADILDGKEDYVLGSEMSFAELNDLYIEANKPNWKPTSHRNHKYVMDKYLLNIIGKKKIKNINNVVVQNKIINPLIEKGFAENTLLSIYRRLNAVVTYAVNNEILEKKRFTRPNLNGAKVMQSRHALTVEEVTNFLSIAKRKYKITHYTALSLLFLTGMRAGELRALKWSDVDFENEILHIRGTKDRYGSRTPKTKNSYRAFPMGNNIKNLLLEYKDWHDDMTKRFAYRNPDNHIFITYAGHPIGERFLKRIIDLICEREKIEHFTPHYFRHTFVTLQLSNNIPISTVASLVGDRPETIYKVYAHSFSKNEDEAVSLMDGIIDFENFKNEKE